MAAKGKQEIYIGDKPAGPSSEVLVIEIAKKIISGGTRIDLVHEIMGNKGISKVQAEKYYDAALRYLLPSPGEEEKFRDKMQAKLIARYEKLYDMAIKQNSVKQAREVLDSMAKLYGLTGGGNKVQIAEDGEGTKVINISFD